MGYVNFGLNAAMVLRPDFNGATRLILSASLASWSPVSQKLERVVLLRARWTLTLFEVRKTSHGQKRREEALGFKGPVR